MKLSDFVWKFLVEQGIKHVFMVAGGGNMHLTDSLGRNKEIKYICCLHEQAVAMVVEAYARTRNKLAVGLVTTGPGGTNTITGVAGAWISSTPCLFISGQVNRKDMIVPNSGVRQTGLQEINICDIVKPIVKSTIIVTEPTRIQAVLQEAIYDATEGRPGPVWVDIPLDVQGALINENNLLKFHPGLNAKKRQYDIARNLASGVAQLIELLKTSKRPIILAGNGIIQADARNEFRQFAQLLNVPVLTTWGGADLLKDDHPLFVGRSGLIGQRGANLSIQNSDLLIAIGTRLYVAHTGYNAKLFARAAKKVVVDISQPELDKNHVKIDVPICCDCKQFLDRMYLELQNLTQGDLNDFSGWLAKCKTWQAKYPMVLPVYWERQRYVDSYCFIDTLSDLLNDDDVIVTGMGTAFTCTMQTFKVKKGQRFFTSSGLAAMGFGLPGSIGACFANDEKRVICITGDGGIQMNIQELQTIVHHKLPIKIFVINNCGYHAIRSHQDANFGGFYVGADDTSGVSLPNMRKIADAYSIKYLKIQDNIELKGRIKATLIGDGPAICEIMMDPKQLLHPKLKSKLNKDGTMSQAPLEDMYPYLSKKEMLENMIIKPVEE